MTGRRSIRVLIINAYDEREMYAEAFRNRGLDVTTAATAAEGLASVTRRPPDVVVQGMAFGDGNGIDLARALTDRLSATGGALIVISGFTDAPTLASIRLTGCDAVLLKPCLPDELLRTIRAVYRSSGRVARASGRRRSSSRD